MSSKGYKQTKEHIQKRLANQANWKKSKYWFGKEHTIEEKQKISKTKRESDTTIKGENHHNWKGGITKEHNKLRGSLEYILWRNEVYKRDEWKCRICNKHCQKGDIVAHHLKKFSDYLELRFIIENGMTLCRKCHMEIEHPNITHT